MFMYLCPWRLLRNVKRKSKLNEIKHIFSQMKQSHFPQENKLRYKNTIWNVTISFLKGMTNKSKQWTHYTLPLNQVHPKGNDL